MEPSSPTPLKPTVPKPPSDAVHLASQKSGAKDIKGLRTFFSDSSRANGVTATEDKAKELAERLKSIPIAPMGSKTPGVPGVTQSKTPQESIEERKARIAREEALRAEQKKEEETRRAKEAEEVKQREAKRVAEEAERARKDEEARIRAEEEKAHEHEREVARLADLLAKSRITLTTTEATIAPILKEKEALLAEKGRIEEVLRPVIDEETRIEAEIEATAVEARATVELEKRQEMERAQWAREDKRREIEKRKWDIEEKLAGVLSSMAQKDGSISTIQKEIARMKNEIAVLEKQKKSHELSVSLKKISEKKNTLEERWVEINDKKEALMTLLAPILEKEHIVAKARAEAEQKEKTAKDFTERKNAEQERWKHGDSLRDIEKERWEKERAVEELNRSLAELRPEYQRALADEEATKRELERLMEAPASSGTQ